MNTTTGARWRTCVGASLSGPAYTAPPVTRAGSTRAAFSITAG